MECTSDCLRRIDPNKHAGLPTINLSNMNMAAKFRLASNLASACNSIGYKIKLEYQTFLYGNVVDVRNLFLFLIERVFREDAVQLECNEEVVTDIKCNPCGVISMLKHRFKFNDHSMLYNLVDSKMDRIDLLFGARESFIKHLWQVRPMALESLKNISSTNTDTKVPLKDATSLIKPPVAPRRQNVLIDFKTTGLGHIPSLCEWNQLNCYDNLQKYLPHFDQSDLVFDRYGKLSIRDDDIPLFLGNVEGTEIKDYTAPLDQSSSTMVIDTNVDSQQITNYSDRNSVDCNKNDFKVRMDILIENNKSLLEQMTIELNRLNSKHEELLDDEKLLHNLEDKTRESRKHLNDLRLASKTVEVLSDDVISAENDLTQLGSSWAEAKSFLKEEMLKLELEVSEISGSEGVILRKKIQCATDSLEANKAGIERNFVAIENLSTKVASFKEKEHDFPRSSFVKMLNEVMKQLKKQNDDLNKILHEVRALQKEINSLSGRLQRSFTLVDEALFEVRRSQLAVLD